MERFCIEGRPSYLLKNHIGDLVDLINLTDATSIVADVAGSMIRVIRSRLTSLDTEKAHSNLRRTIRESLPSEHECRRCLSTEHGDGSEDVHEMLYITVVLDCIMQRVIYEMGRLSKKNLMITEDRSRAIRRVATGLYRSVESDFDYDPMRYPEFEYRTSDVIIQRTGLDANHESFSFSKTKKSVFETIANYIIHVVRMPMEVFDEGYVRDAQKTMVRSVLPSREDVDMFSDPENTGRSISADGMTSIQDDIVIAMVADLVGQFTTMFVSGQAKKVTKLQNDMLSTTLNAMKPAADMLESFRMMDVAPWKLEQNGDTSERPRPHAGGRARLGMRFVDYRKSADDVRVRHGDRRVIKFTHRKTASDRSHTYGHHSRPTRRRGGYRRPQRRDYTPLGERHSRRHPNTDGRRRREHDDDGRDAKDDGHAEARDDLVMGARHFDHPINEEADYEAANEPMLTGE